MSGVLLPPTCSQRNISEAGWDGAWQNGTRESESTEQCWSKGEAKFHHLRAIAHRAREREREERNASSDVPLFIPRSSRTPTVQSRGNHANQIGSRRQFPFRCSGSLCSIDILLTFMISISRTGVHHATSARFQSCIQKAE